MLKLAMCRCFGLCVLYMGMRRRVQQEATLKSNFPMRRNGEMLEGQVVASSVNYSTM